MATLREWVARLGGTFSRGRRDIELEQELRLHLDLAAEEERRSATPESASRMAAIRVGGVAPTMDALRDQRGLPGLEDLVHDLRHSVRTLRHSPTFTIVALLTLAIGIGATTAVFSVVNRVLLKPLAYPHAEELVAVWHKAPGAAGLSTISGDLRLSPSMYFTYAERNRTFQAFGLWFAASNTVTGLAEPEQVPTLLITDGTLQALGVQPYSGAGWRRGIRRPGPRRSSCWGTGIGSVASAEMGR